MTADSVFSRTASRCLRAAMQSPHGVAPVECQVDSRPVKTLPFRKFHEISNPLLNLCCVGNAAALWACVCMCVRVILSELHASA